MNQPAFSTQLYAILACLDALGLALLLGLQIAAWRRSGQRSLLALAVSSACALVCLLACSLGHLLIQDEDLLDVVYQLGEVSGVVQLLTAVGGGIVLMRHYLELLQAPHTTPAPRPGLLQTYGLTAASALGAVNWSVIVLVIVFNLVAWLGWQAPATATWLLIFPAGLMLRTLAPHGQGWLSRGLALLVNVPAAGFGWYIFLNCLIHNPEPIRGCVFSMVLAAAPLSANSLWLLRRLRPSGPDR